MPAPKKSSTKTVLPEMRARPFDRVREVPQQVENLLSRKHQIELRNSATVLEFQRSGASIFSEGEEARFVYSVAAGVVRISRHSDDGRRQVLAFMLPGDMFGLPDSGLYMNSAAVASPSTLYRIPWSRFRDLMMREPAMQLGVLAKVAYDYREAQRRIMILGLQNTYQRLASFLVDFIQHPAFFETRSRCLTLPLTRFDIADYLGTAPETVARGFARLEYEGLLHRITPRVTEIRDMEGLRRLVRRRRRAPG